MERHLVLLGVKANSWAWGLDYCVQLRSQSKEVVAVTFDSLAIKNSIRSKFERETAEAFNLSIISAEELLLKSHSSLSRMAKMIISQIARSPNWVDFQFDSIPLGRVLCSSYARIAGTSIFPIHLIPRSFQLNVVTQILKSHEIYKRLSGSFTHITVANGRGPLDSVFLSLGRLEGKATQALERGASSDKMHIFPNSPHHASDWWKLMEFSSSLIDESQVQNFWNHRLQGLDEVSNRDWSLYADKVENSLERRPQSIVFFTSSTHEIPALPEFSDTESDFKNQESAIFELVNICRRNKEKLIIKRHPNSIGWDGTDREAEIWSWLQNQKDVDYIGPSSRVHPHSLIRNAKAVLCYKSTTGIEAAVMNTPARAMGSAKWAYNAECRAWDNESLETFIRNPSKLPTEVPRKWAFAMSTFGNPMVLFSRVSGGKAIGRNGLEFHSSDYYDRSLSKYYRRIATRVWAEAVRYNPKKSSQ